MRKESLKSLFDRLFSAFGPQKWWPNTLPGDLHPTYNGLPLDPIRRFEIAVGAVLTQNTNWGNVEMALANLNRSRLMNPEAILEVENAILEEAIRPSGYFRLKCDRLRNMTRWWVENVGEQDKPKGDFRHIRESVLDIKGVGKETADSILLYCFDYPTFVIDVYTKRIMARHYGTPLDIDYDDLQNIFMDELPHDPELFQEFHALLVQLAKETCKKRECLSHCPLR